MQTIVANAPKFDSQRPSRKRNMKHMKSYILAIMASAFTLFTSCSFSSTQNSRSNEHGPAHLETISCIYDSTITATTEMFGLTEKEVGKMILWQATLISMSDRSHIHAVFAEGGAHPTFVERGVYEMRGEFKIHNPTIDGKPQKYPIANYRYFLVSSWKLADTE